VSADMNNANSEMLALYIRNVHPHKFLVNPTVEGDATQTHIQIADAVMLLSRFELQFKLSENSMRVLYALIKVFLPQKNNWPSYEDARRLLNVTGSGVMSKALRLAVCVNDCIIFDDSIGSVSMVRCPHCNEPR